MSLVNSLDALRYQAEPHGWTNYPADWREQHQGGERIDYCPAHS